MVFTFSKNIYNLKALMLAAYNFTDRAYIHLDTNESSYIVTATLKDANANLDLNEFENEILAQMIRQYVQSSTKSVRELILARAFSSTVIGTPSDYTTKDDDVNTNIDDILTSWFDKYEQT